MEDPPHFFARAHWTDKKRGYMGITIPPDEIERKKIRAGQMLRVSVELME